MYLNSTSNSPPLPANNISQKLYYENLPNCEQRYDDKGNQVPPAPCCQRDLNLQSYYKKSPKNIWNAATNYQRGPGFSSCTDNAFLKQCMMSQYYTYLSKNNILPK